MPHEQPTHQQQVAQGFLDAAYEEHLTEQPGRVPGADISQEAALSEVRSITPIVPQVRQLKIAEQRKQKGSELTAQESKKTDILKKTLALIAGDPEKLDQPSRVLTERDLMRLESEIGRTLFGDIPQGHRREFFCLDEGTWIWHEKWTEAESDKLKMLTIRYEVHPNGILKVQENQPYKFVEGQELRNLAVAARMYYERTMTDIYERNPATGQKLTRTPDTINTGK